jgi:hypothetical protein
VHPIGEHLIALQLRIAIDCRGQVAGFAGGAVQQRAQLANLVEGDAVLRRFLIRGQRLQRAVVLGEQVVEARVEVLRRVQQVGAAGVAEQGGQDLDPGHVAVPVHRVRGAAVMARERGQVARVAADLVLRQHGAEEHRVRPAVFGARALRADEAIGGGVIDGIIDLFEGAPVHVLAPGQVTGLERPIDPVAGLLKGPPGRVRAVLVAVRAAPELHPKRIAADLHVTGQAVTLAFEVLADPACRADLAQVQAVKLGIAKLVHGIILLGWVQRGRDGGAGRAGPRRCPA